MPHRYISRLQSELLAIALTAVFALAVASFLPANAQPANMQIAEDYDPYLQFAVARTCEVTKES